VPEIGDDHALNPINVFDAWNTQRAKFTLEVVGALPEHDGTGDVIAHVSGKLKYKSWTRPRDVPSFGTRPSCVQRLPRIMGTARKRCC
jgi:hypothetical protein